MDNRLEEIRCEMRGTNGKAAPAPPAQRKVGIWRGALWVGVLAVIYAATGRLGENALSRSVADARTHARTAYTAFQELRHLPQEHIDDFFAAYEQLEKMDVSAPGRERPRTPAAYVYIYLTASACAPHTGRHADRGG